MAIINRTQAQKLALANKMAVVHNRVLEAAYNREVKFATELDTALAALKVELDATIADVTPVP